MIKGVDGDGLDCRVKVSASDGPGALKALLGDAVG
jgi:hypothetical protein